MIRSSARTAAFLALSALAFAAPAFADRGDIDKVNGSIRLEANETAGDLSTVNGSIHVGDRATAQKVETVNGEIELRGGATARSVETVNGSIELGDGARVDRDAETVNGRVTLGRGAEIGGHVSNVNGEIRLDGAHVGNGLETVSGDVTVGADSRVEGGIIVDKPTGWFIRDRKPRITIGPHAVVQGKLEFRREVQLMVSDSAKIGDVVGATPQTFSGDRP